MKEAPQDVPAREALVRAYLEGNQLDSARRAAEDLELAAPTLAAGPYIAGLVAHAQKRLDDAQKNFEKALKLQPSATDALTALTKLDIERGRTPAALARVKAVADADPNNVLAAIFSVSCTSPRSSRTKLSSRSRRRPRSRRRGPCPTATSRW